MVQCRSPIHIVAVVYGSQIILSIKVGLFASGEGHGSLVFILYESSKMQRRTEDPLKSESTKRRTGNWLKSLANASV